MIQETLELGLKQGLVTKITSHYAIVMSKGFEIERISLKEHMSVGDQIHYTSLDIYQPLQKLKKWTPLSFASASAAAIFLVIMVSLAYQWMSVPTTFAVVTMDINPSIEISVDSTFHVIKVTALNADARSVVEANMTGLELVKVMQTILKNAADKGFLLANDMVLVTTTYADKSNNQTDVSSRIGAQTTISALSTLENSLKQQEISFIEKNTTNYQFIYYHGTEAELSKAKAVGLSLGKYKMLEILEGEVSEAEIKDMKMTDIVAKRAVQAAVTQSGKDTFETFFHEDEESVDIESHQNDEKSSTSTAQEQTIDKEDNESEDQPLNNEIEHSKPDKNDIEKSDDQASNASKKTTGAAIDNSKDTHQEIEKQEDEHEKTLDYKEEHLLPNPNDMNWHDSNLMNHESEHSSDEDHETDKSNFDNQNQHENEDTPYQEESREDRNDQDHED